MIKRANTGPHTNILTSSLDQSEKISQECTKKQLTIITNTTYINPKNSARKGSSQSEPAMFGIRNTFKQHYQPDTKKQIFSPMTPKYRHGRYTYQADKTYSNKYMQKQKSMKSGGVFKFDKYSIIPCQDSISSQSPTKNKTEFSEQQCASRWATTKSDRQKLSEETIQKLSQFIEYQLQKQKEIQLTKQQFLAQMQKYPLEIKQEELKQIRQRRVEQQQKLNQILAECKPRHRQIEKQAQLTQTQNQKYNILAIQLVSNHAQHKQLQKQIIKLQNQIIIKEKSVNEEYQQFQQTQKKIIKSFIERNIQVQEKLNKYQQQMREILQAKSRIQKMKQRKTEIIQQNLELQNIQKNLIKNSSINDLKAQLQSAADQQENTSIKLSNNQIKQNFYSNLRKKLTIIKNTISTQSENFKFLNSLKLAQKESQGVLSITPQSNTLTQDEIKTIQNNRVQYKRYRQYLKQDTEILKLQQVLNEEKNKYENKIKKGREQVDRTKLTNNQCISKIKDLDNMQKIRSAQIQELKKIVNSKQQQMNDLQRKAAEQKKFDSFRDVLIGVSGLGGLNMQTSSSKNKN